MLREDGVGVKLLAENWFQEDGANFLRTLVKPVVERIAPIKKSLEVLFTSLH